MNIDLFQSIMLLVQAISIIFIARALFLHIKREH